MMVGGLGGSQSSAGQMLVLFLYSGVSQPPARGPVPGPGIQLDRAARGSAGICHFSFLSNFSLINVL